MRVVLVIERFLPDGGGMESVAWQVADGLARAGDDVHVLARAHAEAPFAAVHRVRVASRWQPARVASFARGAAALARTLAPDVVHAFSRTLVQDVYRAGGGSHADYLARTHGTAARALRRLSPRHALLLSLERRIFDRTPLIQCGSAMVAREIASRFGVPDARLPVVYNGVDAARFAPERVDRAADLPRRGDGPVWLFAGSGFRRKGLDTAMRALAASACDRALLWVAGRDDPRPWRRRAAALGVADRVAFLGHRRDLERVYPAADALLLPTRYDAFANVCLEAAAAGLPIATSGANGSAEPFRGVGGVVVDDPEDVAGFAAALDRLASPRERTALGDAARGIAVKLTWDAHVDALRALYRGLRR